MDLIVETGGIALWGGQKLRCAIGHGGIRREKREGDGATPEGSWHMRRLLYRPDRFPAPPRTALPAEALHDDDGWCDDDADPLYNQKVKLPFRARAEQLWREDGLYDLIIPFGYNDEPVKPGLGSAIFLHVAAPGYLPTEGCVALSLTDLLKVLGGADTGSRVILGS